MKSFNYDIQPGDWKPLSDIMADDYEIAPSYHIRVNSGRNSLRFIEMPEDAEGNHEAPSNMSRGKEYPPFSEFTVAADSGDRVYLSCGMYPVNVYIEEVTA